MASEAQQPDPDAIFQVATSFMFPARSIELSVSMFCMPCIWNKNSLPSRRAGSPVHSSDGLNQPVSVELDLSGPMVGSGSIATLLSRALLRITIR